LIVVRLKDQGYLNDAKYATAFSSYRRDNENSGACASSTNLKAKGVHGEVIEKAVSSVYDDVKEENLARAYLRRKRCRSPRTGIRSRRLAFRQLMRAGLDRRPSLRS